jgi:hypothetical protein
VQFRNSSIPEQYRLLRESGTPPRNAWNRIKQEFIANSTAKDPEQAWKNASGSALEQIVKGEFDRQIQEQQLSNSLRVQRWREIREELVKRILSENLWIRGELQEPYPAESQVDFVATEQEEGRTIRVIAVFSCKASLRERFQQDLYWAEKFRERGIRFCFITLDNDGVLLRAATSGELSSKQAKMATALYDRIYLITDEPIQHYKRVFRPIDNLVEDLKRWLEAW